MSISSLSIKITNNFEDSYNLVAADLKNILSFTHLKENSVKMDAEQFQTFLTTFTDTMKTVMQDKGKGKAGGSNINPSPKIALRIPTFRGEPGKNVEV